MSIEPAKPQTKLSRAERRQLAAAKDKAQKYDPKHLSAQQSIPYDRVWPDGIVRVNGNRYTKTIQFMDCTYQLAQKEDQEAIFDAWSNFLNYFDSSISVQLSFLNLAANKEDFEQYIQVPLSDGPIRHIQEEYQQILRNQFAKGNNGLVKTKYITFGIEANNLKAAKPRLERIETDLINNFKQLGVSSTPLDGKERLRLMHDIFHMDPTDRFQFSWNQLVPSGMSTKDFIAPSAFEFKDGRTFRLGEKYGTVSFLQILAPELSDQMLKDFLDMNSSQIVTMHIQSVDQVSAIKTIKRKITDIDRMKIEEVRPDRALCKVE